MEEQMNKYEYAALQIAVIGYTVMAILYILK